MAAADLGSGGGLPALPLALAWPGTRWLLIETIGRRAAFLQRAVSSLALADRMVVAHGRAEVAGRAAASRGAHDLVTSRGVGPPAVAAELGAPLLREGGVLIVSEPPGGHPDRWPAAGLAELGLGPASLVTAPAGTYVVIRGIAACPERFPRKAGMAAKRPLFDVPRETSRHPAG
ncbi:MAG: rRNA small subunit methyltransferase [Acidimicrobiales bacterium]|jgi:16S rRNA (guanine527-N7)-methyltransferase|nr:rRNA small subunit methyltransferase [Acidimicrobiales bacterium]